MPNQLTISNDGIDRIIAHEEDINGLYDDPKGYATYGVGHLVHPEKYRSFLLHAAQSEKLCVAGICRSKISKSTFLAREVSASEDYEKLKGKAREKAAKAIAIAKFKKAYTALSPTEKATVETLAEQTVTRETDLMNRTVKDVFGADLKQYERAVNAGATAVTLAQEEFDALVSFAFNVGAGALARSKLLKKINENKHRNGSVVEREQAIAEIVTGFLAWNKAGGQVLAGLTKRRREEADCFVKVALAELKTMKEAGSLKTFAASSWIEPKS